MTLEQVGIIFGIIGSVVAIGISLIKKNPEINKLNSETISNLTASISDTTENYNKLSKEFEEYKVKMNETVRLLEEKLKGLSDENFTLRVTNETQAKTITRLTKWVERLCEQLKDNRIVPVTCDPE